MVLNWASLKGLFDRAVHRLSDDIPRDDVIKARLELLKQLKRVVKQARKADA
ncbi:hypothetical protein [Streptomyces sp. ISL-100]|uniref:hypothetical protein n=1 Tax=Streptomyces sp. ISL-100 TaxID=2819173 RepID=UPI001BEC94E6|nr:hypothetical protein [Streptomyces sp. ISL-100]MBT2399776.1 hypothetical protein [Streptomyces sp. ISL-100]